METNKYTVYIPVIVHQASIAEAIFVAVNKCNEAGISIDPDACMTNDDVHQWADKNNM
jgi:hypothetical protein